MYTMMTGNKQNIMKKELKLLNETITYYSASSKRRCLINGKCVYSPITSNKIGVSEGCAIGRLMSKRNAKKLDDSEQCGIGVDLALENYEDLFPKKVLSLNKEFLADLQFLHDSNNFWNPIKGLSKAGKEYVNKVIKRYNLK